MLTREGKEAVNYTSEQKILSIFLCLVKALRFVPNAKILVWYPHFTSATQLVGQHCCELAAVHQKISRLT